MLPSVLLPTPRSALSEHFVDDAGAALGVAVQLSHLSAELAGKSALTDTEVLGRALRLVCQLFPDAASASLIRYSRSKPVLVACDQAQELWLDAAQRSIGQGPAVDAHDLDMLTIMSTWTSETRWPQLLAQLPPEPRIESLVSVPLTAGGHSNLVLNIYARRPGVFDGLALHLVTLAAAGLALVLTALDQREQIEHLTLALDSNRRIGAAMGVIMATLHCAEDEAFLMLRSVSQHTHTKLHAVADQVLYTGALPDFGNRTRTRRGSTGEHVPTSTPDLAVHPGA